MRDDGRLIGMGRVVGDGLHVQVVDVAVHPSRQGEGLSRLVLDDIVRFLLGLPDRTAAPAASTGMFLRDHDVARERGGVL